MEQTLKTHDGAQPGLSGESFSRQQACRQLATMVARQMQRRRQVQPVTSATQWEAVELLRNNGFTIDQARLDRVFNDPHAQPVHGNVSMAVAGYEVTGLVKGTYHARIVVAPSVDCDCDCPDWLQSGGKANTLPCKHILGLAVDASLAGIVPQPTSASPVALQPEPVQPPVPAMGSEAEPGSVETGGFPGLVAGAISRAVESLADQVQAVLELGEIPFLIGPTDCGKTSAVRRVAVRNGWRFEPVEGCESYADLDLVGAIIDGKRLPGPFARAFGQARGESQTASKVLIFLDEFTRFNTRAMDILMTPLLPTPADVARLMGIDATEEVRYINAPLWGREWAPAAGTPVVLACNPWGSPLDPALLRRTLPLQVDFAPEVAALFRSPLRDAVEKSWEMAREGRLPLPVGYKALRTASAPDDRRFITPYLLRLRAADPAAAEGYRKIVEAAGFRF